MPNRPGQGRKRTPTAIREARGTERFRKDQRKHEPKASDAKPKCPTHLDRRAKAEWRAIVKIMEGQGTLSADFLRSLTLYCTAYSKYLEALDLVNKTGIVVYDEKGNARRNPAQVEFHKYHDQCYKWLTEFGLTPSAKARVMVEKKEEKQDAWAAFLEGSKHRN